jgi:uncharacterized protein
MAMRDVRRDFTILVRLHVDKENYAALPQFIDEYRRAFGQDSRFKLFLRTLSHLGGPNDAMLPVFEEEEGRNAVNTLSRCAAEHRVEHITTKHITPICYASRANSFVVRANGRLNKCTVALEHPMNQVGRIYEDGRIELEAPKMRMWMRGLQSGNPDELECPMHGYADPVPKTAAEAAPNFRLELAHNT